MPVEKWSILFDFESGTYEGWTIRGTSFSGAPASGPIGNRSPITGAIGKYFLNSYGGGSDRSTGLYSVRC